MPKPRGPQIAPCGKLHTTSMCKEWLVRICMHVQKKGCLLIKHTNVFMNSCMAVTKRDWRVWTWYTHLSKRSLATSLAALRFGSFFWSHFPISIISLFTWKMAHKVVRSTPKLQALVLFTYHNESKY